ncbi:hypothetical protein KY285_030237 [Solanum tuberosum]|nr:hypothetical protein KY285_030237 [Solanum tuberosum]
MEHVNHQLLFLFFLLNLDVHLPIASFCLCCCCSAQNRIPPSFARNRIPDGDEVEECESEDEVEELLRDLYPNLDGGTTHTDEGYIANECMTLCSRTLGAKNPFELEADELEQAHIYILKNCDEVLPYLEEFAQTHENAHHLSDVEWNQQFIEWFKDRVAQLHKGDASLIMEDLLSLSRGPTRYSTHSNDSENLDYYGVLTDVIELQFVMDRRVMLFRCNWFDVYDEIKGVKKDEYDFVSVNPDIFLKTNEPFVLADQASQVFYANDNSNKGKGRGQGLTNSTLFTSQGMATIPKNSIDLEKENKQTNPSAHASTNIGKGRRQGLTNSTLFTSQRMATKPKNSIDLEKENKQTNPSAHASTNLGSIGKGRGQGLKSSTFSTSQGMGMKHNNYMTSDSEVGCINKSALYANQHIKTPSKSTRANSTMSSSQEMQRTDKMILEIEDMQTNSFPASIDQVIEHSQITEKGSSNPTKVRRVRGSNMCKEVASLENGEKLKVTFYNNRTVGTNSKLFLRHLGKIVRDRNICPLGVTSWSDIKQEKLSHMWVGVEHKFEAFDMNDHRDHIMGWMNELWNKWRRYLHAKYAKDNPIQQSLKNIPRGVDRKEWEWLVKEHFTSESFQGGKDGNPPDLATIFFETRKKDNKLVEPEAIEKHAQLEEIVQEDPSLTSIEIIEKCCGPQTRSHVFGFGGGVKAKDLKGGTSSKAEILSALRSTRDDNKFLNEENKSLIEENKSLNDRLSTLEDTMKEIMKMKELFAAQHSDVPPIISPFSTE